MSNKPISHKGSSGPTKNSDPNNTASTITVAGATSSHASTSTEEPKTPFAGKSATATSPSKDPLPGSATPPKRPAVRCVDCGLMLLSDSYAEQRLHWATKHGPSVLGMMEEVEIDGMVVVDTKEEQEEEMEREERKRQIWVLVVEEDIAGGYVTINESW